MSARVAFTDLATAAYCPRKLYYRRREDPGTPPVAAQARALAANYDRLLGGDAGAYAAALAVPEPVARDRLERARDRLADWPGLRDPAETDAHVAGRDCHGVVHKLTPGATPSLVSPGEPPENGVWHPQSVKAVAAAKAVAWREQEPVERAYVEYPRYGVIREVRLTGRRKAAYRRALRAVRGLDGPPARLRDDAKCDACEYQPRCGVKTRSLRSLL